MSCDDDLVLDFAALGDGKLSPTLETCRPLAAHLMTCEGCQIYLAIEILQWGRQYKLPPEPQILARWRPSAVHRCYAGSDVQGTLLRPGEDRRTAWQRRLRHLEHTARMVYVESEEGPLTHWLAELAELSRAAGGFAEDPTQADLN